MPAGKKIDKKVKPVRGQREAAEKKARRSGSAPRDAKKPDVDGLIHEHQVRRIELEIQNDELRESEQHLRRFYESGMIGVIYWNIDGQITSANDKFLEMLGYTRDDLAAGRINGFAMTPPEYRHVDDASVAELMVNGINKAPLEKEYVRKDGTRVPVILSGAMLDESRTRGVAFVLDNTGRKQAEKALKESEDKYRLIVENTGDNITVFDMNLQITYVSPSILKLRGYSAEEAKTQNLDQILLPESLKKIGEVFAEQMALEAEGAADPQRRALVELEEYCKDGSRIWVEDVYSFIRDDYGRPTGILSVSRDITERKRLEQEISDTSRFLDSIIEQSPNPMWISDEKGTLVRINKACCDILKITPEEVVGRYNILEDNIVIEQGLTPLVRSVFEEGKSVNFDLVYDTSFLDTVVLGSSVKVFLNVTIFPVKDNTGNIHNAVIQHVDITERKRADEALKKKNDELVRVTDQLRFTLEGQDRARLVLLSILEDEKLARQVIRDSEEKYRLLIETTPCVICRIQPDGTTIFVNDYVGVVTGYAPDELIGRNWWEVLYPAQGRNKLMLLLDEYKRGDVRGREMTLTARDGSFKILQWDSFNKYGTDGELIEINSVGLDITGRKMAEQRFRYQFQFLYVVINAIKAPIFFKDTEGRYSGCNTAFEEFAGHPLSELVGKTVFDLWPPETAGVYHRKDRELLESGSDQFYETQDRFADGTLHDMLYHKSLFGGWTDKVGGIVGVMVDITERKRAEQAVRESQRFALSTVNALDANIAILDGNGEMLSVNSSWRKFAYDNAQDPLDVFEGVNYLSICDHVRGDRSEGAAEFAAGIRAVMSGEKETFSQEYPCHSPSDQRWFVGKVTRFPGEGPLRVVVSHTDITERKFAEEKIAASLREKEILLKEIHHRVKNNMQVISSLMGLQSSYIMKGADTKNALSEMQNRIKSMAIVHEKLYQSGDFSRINFHDYLSSLVVTITQSLGMSPERVKMVMNVRSVTMGIDTAVPCGLLVNELISNAIKHAFPDGRSGVITISMDMTGDDRYQLSVSDNGAGMPAGFNLNSSDSLGLRLVRILTQQLGGTINVRSGEGAEFIITFPRGKEDRSDERK